MTQREIKSDEIFVTKVIICTKTRRGNGVEGDPIRIITEVFTLDGKLIAEYDPIKSNQ